MGPWRKEGLGGFFDKMRILQDDIFVGTDENKCACYKKYQNTNYFAFVLFQTETISEKSSLVFKF